MCLILFAYETHPVYSLILAANRDEFLDRPTAPLGQWPDHPRVFAGRDLKASGTWMGINQRGSLAAVTNFRDPANINPQAPSRGDLVADFLIKGIGAPKYLEQVKARGHLYNGFNLLAGDAGGLYYYGNRDPKGVRRLEPGYYGLSNPLLNTAWPKVEKGLQALTAALENDRQVRHETIFDLLTDQTIAEDDRLPKTGVSLEWERTLSPIFIRSPNYGTRSSSLLLVKRDGDMTICERSWSNASEGPLALETRCFSVSAMDD